ncbi:uncharacterized protein EI90DRAFT_3015372 [Cantharellus anzutake]|uniref:uncharacterized protein n=1 Tax=Cantharellus anzutake TaxID=1750568 RepID=UPI00190522F0|nr:uncharacterized protein EI90DRAFT_3015372 [Cantharellus anzutake]KAF8333486.1 hypothetical protein EI90DRAFT_3015372 [Cantharellus anzutake]
MRLWSAFISITLLPVVMADFFVGEMTCSQRQPFGAIVPPYEASICGMALDYSYYHGENRSYGTLMEVQGLCGADVGVNTVSNFWIASNGLIGHCDTIVNWSNQTSILMDGQKCTWGILKHCHSAICP